MTTTSFTSSMLTILLAATLPLVPVRDAHAASIKRSKSDRDINAIGHRDILHGKERAFLNSPEKEKELGAQYFAAFERSAKLIRDPEITDYLSALVQNIARNSDAHMPITVIVVDSNTVNACTSPGGYQYLTRGLLAHTQTEGELAAVLAHGIAHTVLHSPTKERLRQALITVVTSTPQTITPKAIPVFTCTSLFSLPMTSGLLKADEFDADYFGVQYLYKAGYDPECYFRFIQLAWPAGTGSPQIPAAFSPFPPASERLKTLRREIVDVLPTRKKSIVSTSGFEEFQGHLGTLPSTPPEADQPVLLRHDAKE